MEVIGGRGGGDPLSAGLTELLACVDKWSTLHRRGEALLNSFSGDIASVVPVANEEGSATREVRERLGGITARRDASLSSAPIQAEKRLMDIRAMMDELEKLLTKMEDIVATAKRNAALQSAQDLVSRGRYGAQQSSMDKLHLMTECLTLYQAEFELKESIVSSLTYSMSSLELTTYIMAWKTKPFASDWQRAYGSMSAY